MIMRGERRCFIELAQFALRIKLTLGNVDAYPAIGATGKQSFIEIAQGSMSVRTILATIYVDFGDELRLDSLETFPEDREAIIILPEHAHSIGFVRLLETVFGNPCRVLHPLDSRGDFFPDWREALNVFSSVRV